MAGFVFVNLPFLRREICLFKATSHIIIQYVPLFLKMWKLAEQCLWCVHLTLPNNIRLPASPVASQLHCVQRLQKMPLLVVSCIRIYVIQNVIFKDYFLPFRLSEVLE